MTKLNRGQLRRLIFEEINEGYGIDTGLKQREVGNSSFEAAQKDAKANGKAYFIKSNNEVIVFDSDGNADARKDITAKDAYDANDGTVHYKGSL